MSSLRRFMCRRGLHLWSRARVRQYAEHRVVSRECWFCDTSRSVVQDVWSEPVRAAAPSWADDVRRDARPGGAA